MLLIRLTRTHFVAAFLTIPTRFIAVTDNRLTIRTLQNTT